jgi:signal transduction histidine kinase
MSLRWRLTLYYSALSALIVVLSGVAFFVVLRQSLQNTLDTSLQDAAELAAGQLSDEQSGKFTEAQTDTLLERLSGGTTLTVFDNQGEEIDHVGQARVRAALVEGLSDSESDKRRVYGLLLANSYWIQASRSQVETLQAIGRARGLLLAGLPFLLLIGFGVGYFLADGALKPVDRVTGLAERIANSGQVRERMPELPGHDEMARLTHTFNSMLARLETTLEREKAFALAAAHELRTPLAFLQGRSSLSLEKPRSIERYQRDLAQIHEVSQGMSGMVESLLALARTNQAGVHEPVALTGLLRDVVRLYEVDAKDRCVTLEPCPSEVVLYGDKTALQLALGNLVQNAIKYGREGGHVWLRDDKQNNKFFIEVCDDGPGIPEAELERLRQPFQRGAGLQGVRGSGLGLALASAVAEQQGGRLELSRASQGGLRAVLWLRDNKLRDDKK